MLRNATKRILALDFKNTGGKRGFEEENKEMKVSAGMANENIFLLRGREHYEDGLTQEFLYLFLSVPLSFCLHFLFQLSLLFPRNSSHIAICLGHAMCCIYSRCLFPRRKIYRLRYLSSTRNVRVFVDVTINLKFHRQATR